MVRIFCMRGLPFSSSFFTKDLFLECTVSISYTYIFYFIIFGSIITIAYSRKILSLAWASYHIRNSVNFKKKSIFFFSVIFSSLTLICSFYTYPFFTPSSNPIVSSQDINLVIILIAIFMVIYLKFGEFKSWLRAELFFSKFSTFSRLNKIYLLDFSSSQFNDHLVFKPSMISSLRYDFKMNFGSVTLFVIFLRFYFSMF